MKKLAFVGILVFYVVVIYFNNEIIIKHLEPFGKIVIDNFVTPFFLEELAEGKIIDLKLYQYRNREIVSNSTQCLINSQIEEETKPDKLVALVDLDFSLKLKPFEISAEEINASIINCEKNVPGINQIYAVRKDEQSTPVVIRFEQSSVILKEDSYVVPIFITIFEVSMNNENKNIDHVKLLFSEVYFYNIGGGSLTSERGKDFDIGVDLSISEYKKE